MALSLNLIAIIVSFCGTLLICIIVFCVVTFARRQTHTPSNSGKGPGDLEWDDEAVVCVVGGKTETDQRKKGPWHTDSHNDSRYQIFNPNTATNTNSLNGNTSTPPEHISCVTAQPTHACFFDVDPSVTTHASSKPGFQRELSGESNSTNHSNAAQKQDQGPSSLLDFAVTPNDDVQSAHSAHDIDLDDVLARKSSIDAMDAYWVQETDFGVHVDEAAIVPVSRTASRKSVNEQHPMGCFANMGVSVCVCCVRTCTLCV